MASGRRKAEARVQRRKIEFPPLVLYDEDLGCLVRLDGWQMEIKRPRERKTLEAFGLNLSYSPISLEPRWLPVKRYDCKHHYVEKHEYWRSPKPQRIPEWEGKPLSEVLTLAREDLMTNYAHYVRLVRQARLKRGRRGQR